MDWKREAADKLRNYEARKQATENIQEEIKRLEIEYTSIRSAVTAGPPVSGGGSSREDVLLNNIAHREELKRRLRDVRLWVSQVDKALGVLDADERIVLDRLYIHQSKASVIELCEKLNLEKSSVYRKRDNALRRFTIALYGATETE